MLADVCVFGGAALVVTGVALMHLPLAIVLGGALLIGIGILYERGRR